MKESSQSTSQFNDKNTSIKPTRGPTGRTTSRPKTTSRAPKKKLLETISSDTTRPIKEETARKKQADAPPTTRQTSRP